jgi:protein-tyrosine phosphatase
MKSPQAKRAIPAISRVQRSTAPTADSLKRKLPTPTDGMPNTSRNFTHVPTKITTSSHKPSKLRYPNSETMSTSTSTMTTEEGDNIPWAWVKATKDILSSPSLPDLPSPPVELLAWLYLANLNSVRKGARLKELGITHVLSTNNMPPKLVNTLREEFDRFGIQHCHVNGVDESGYDMIGNHWSECEAFFNKVYEEGGKVVVHCSAGVNRSGLIAAAVWLLVENTTLLEVVRAMKNKRGIVLINESFQKQLCILAAENEKLGPKPEGYSDDPIPSIGPPPTMENEFLDGYKRRAGV